MKIPSLGGIGKSIGEEAAGGIAHAFKASKRSEQAARNIGGQIGKAAGEYAPIALGLIAKQGAIIKRRRGRQVPIPAILHSGESVLPYGVALTKGQKKAIHRRQKGRGNTVIMFHQG